MANKDFRLPFNDLINHVPRELRNPVLTSLIDNLFNRFMTHDESVPLYGYVGARPSRPDDATPRVPQADAERDVNGIVPVLTFSVGAEDYAFTVQDLIARARAMGVSPGGLQWLYSRGHNYAPPIDLDKFTNFFNYYWVAGALQSPPDMPWNAELLPEYYVIAAPGPSDPSKLNVAAATTGHVVLTGTGFEPQSYDVSFTSPAEFTVAHTGALGEWTPVRTQFQLTEPDEQAFSYVVSRPDGSTAELLSFTIARDEIYNEDGTVAGRAAFEAGDAFHIDAAFLSRNHSVTFSGSPGVKGKLSRVRTLSAYQEVDGVPLREGDRVLVKDNAPGDNGIYVVRPQAWERAADFDGGTAAAGATAYARAGEQNGGTLFRSFAAGGGHGWEAAGEASNTNDWQEGNFWVRGDALAAMGLTRAQAVQAVRPIIEYAGDVRLNAFVEGGRPAETGSPSPQRKAEFNQAPLFDLYRYDGTHAGLASPAFFYVEDPAADLDVALQRRASRASTESGDFLFDHGMADASGAMLFVKRGGELRGVWAPGYDGPAVAGVVSSRPGGALSGVEARGFTQQQVWTLTAEDADTFAVRGSKSGEVGEAEVGQPYDNGELALTVEPAAYEPGDTITVRVGNVESPRYVRRAADGSVQDVFGGPDADPDGEGAWQLPRTFYNNPYSDGRQPVEEGTLYSHFRGILANQVEGMPFDPAFGGSIKLWSEQHSLLASLLMQRDLTPVTVIDLAQRQYETALGALRDIYESRDWAPSDPSELLDAILAVRAQDEDSRTVLRDSTSPLPGFPPTLPMLGIARAVRPAIEFDNVLGATLMTHHDGHKSPLSGDSALDAVVLEAETRLYDASNPEARLYDFSAAEEDPAFRAQLRRELFTFAATNGYDPLAPDYQPSDAFTWNYSQASSFAPVDAPSVPARWHEALAAHQRTVAGVLPTARPNLEPWRLLGHGTRGDWWASLTDERRAAYSDVASSWSVDGGAVRAVDTDPGPRPLAGLQVVDGVQLAEGDRVLLQAQTSPANNGVWLASSGPWARAALPLVAGLRVTASDGARSGTSWVLSAGVAQPGTDPAYFRQLRAWGEALWADVRAARPGLRTSVDSYRDGLLPPYVSPSSPHAADALTNVVPSGSSRGYEFGEGGPVEAVWRRSVEFGYSLARALFRHDPLAFLGFCWGFHWVEVDGVLYDSADLNVPGHRRLALHGEPVAPVARAGAITSGIPVVTNGVVAEGPVSAGGAPGGTITITYDAYSESRSGSWTVRTSSGLVLGQAREGAMGSFHDWDGAGTFWYAVIKIEDRGVPFRPGDSFVVRLDGATGSLVSGVDFVPAAYHRVGGFGQVFAHALREASIDESSGYAMAALRGWDVYMGWRAGGLVATDDLMVSTDAGELPPSAYRLHFKRNPAARDEWAQALRVTLVQVGAHTPVAAGYVPRGDGSDWVFRVEGYNPRHVGVTYFELGGQRMTFHALGGEHTDLVWTRPTAVEAVVTDSLPVVVTGVQAVADLLFGYSSYLESRGFEFSHQGPDSVDAETGRVRGWQLEVEKFIDRCFAGIATGEGHVVNPFMDRIWFRQDRGLLSEFPEASLFDVTGHPGVFDAGGVRFSPGDLRVLRGNESSEVAAAAPMFSVHVQTDEFEHLFIFGHRAQPSTGEGLLYDPFSGSRVVTYRFNGRRQAGSTMRPEMGGHYLVGDEVRRNLQASADGFAGFYDASRAFEDEQTSRHALSLLGFGGKGYLDALGISSKAQFNFWRGLIQSKGTNASIDAYLNNNRFDEAMVDEYWAYKVAEYGDSRPHSFPELRLTVSDAVAQFTQLQFDAEDGSHIPGFTQVSSLDESRWGEEAAAADGELRFESERVGAVAAQAVAGEVIRLPFVADRLELAGPAQRVNATAVRATADGAVSVVGWGPAAVRHTPVKLFNHADRELVEEIPFWHPAAGHHTPAAMESVNLVSSEDPARYNYSTRVVNNPNYDPLRPWGRREVGRVWLDTTNLRYTPYHDRDVYPAVSDRLSRWGTLADYATVDVYEWVSSPVPPSQYDELARRDAGDADIDRSSRASGEAARRQTYVRDRVWRRRPVAWSHSAVPAAGAHEGPAAFERAGLGTLRVDGGAAWLEAGTFAQLGIAVGQRIGAFDFDPDAMRPLSEGTITEATARLEGASAAVSAAGVAWSVEVWRVGATPLGPVVFSPSVEASPLYAEDGSPLPESDYQSVVRVIESDTGDSRSFVLATVRGPETVGPDGSVSRPTVRVTQGVAEVFDLSASGLMARLTPASTADVDVGYAGAALSALELTVRDAVTVDWAVPLPAGAVADPSTLSNDLDLADAEEAQSRPNRYVGWTSWEVPTQAQLDADGRQPDSSWVPFVGEPTEITPTDRDLADAAADAESPLTLNDGTVVSRYDFEWTDWELLEDVIVEAVNVGTGDRVALSHDAFAGADVAVYVNGVAQLRSAFSASGSTVTVRAAPASAVTAIVRRYEPTDDELGFDPDVEDDLAFQRQYKQDYQYVAVPVRDREGSVASTEYFFWARGRSTAAHGKRASVQAVAQELREGPDNFLTFQASDAAREEGRYDAVTISGLGYVVTRDDTFRLRLTRDFTLRDDPEDLNRKGTHTEWTLIRAGQKTRVPEALWRKLTDSVAGEDAAGNSVPALRRELYDERAGAATRWGFGPEQALAPADMLRRSVSHAILNTRLVSDGAPDYMGFLDYDDPDGWFADPASARRTMTDIWNSGKPEQVNEVFFAALEDVLASNYELTDLFKTSRLAAYSIKVVRPSPVAPTYE